MKLHKLIIVSCISLATMLSVASCKKSSTNTLVGTWKLTQTGVDSNNNGVSKLMIRIYDYFVRVYASKVN